MKSFSNYNIYIKNSGLYLLSTLIISALQVVVNPFFAINLTPEDYAAIGYYQGFSNLFTPLIGFFIIDFYLRKFYNINTKQRDVLKGNVIKMLVYFSALVSVLCMIGLYGYVRIADVSIAFSPYAILTVAQLYFSMILAFQLAEYRILGDAKKYSILTIVSGIATIMLSILFVVVLKWGATGKLLGAMLSSLFFFVYLLLYNKKYWCVKLDVSLIKEMVRFSTPLVMAGMLGFFSTGYDKVLLEKAGNIRNMGIYCVGAQIAGYLNIFATAIKSTFQPNIYKALSEKDLSKVCKVMGAVIGCVAILVFLFIVFCPILIQLLTANRYIESTPFARIVALSVITSTIYYQISQVTYGSGLSRLTLINKIIGTVLTLILYTILIPTYGAYGAAWCTVFSFLIYAVINLLLLLLKRKSFLK